MSNFDQQQPRIIDTMSYSTPVHFFSHGSTMMLGEESNSATYWKKCGDEALQNGVKHVVMMASSLALLSIQHCMINTILGCSLGNTRR